jgi:hypothetical protein
MNTFSNSFYLKTLNNSLLLVTNHHLHSPVTINLDSTISLNGLVNPDDQFCALQGKAIHTARGLTIDLSEAVLYERPSRFVGDLNYQFGGISDSLSLASFLLAIINTTQSVLDPGGLAHQRVAAFVRDGIPSIRTHNGASDMFYHAAMKIVGLGYGFTPSGDDFLGGFLATYNSLARSINREPILLQFRDLRERTSWISARLLDYMQRLVLDEQVDNVITCAAEGRVDALVETIELVLSRGHTSGIDIATGIVLALSLIQDLVFRTRQTEKTAMLLGLLSLSAY